jgi:hypothetical protein
MNLPDWVVSGWEMRIGSIVVVVGGTGAFVANLFHPHDFPTQTEPLLRMVAGAPHWSHLHFLIMTSDNCAKQECFLM